MNLYFLQVFFWDLTFICTWKIGISGRTGCFNTPLSHDLAIFSPFTLIRGIILWCRCCTKHLIHRYPFSEFCREDRGSHTLNNSFRMWQERWSWEQNQGLCNTKSYFSHYATPSFQQKSLLCHMFSWKRKKKIVHIFLTHKAHRV